MTDRDHKEQIEQLSEQIGEWATSKGFRDDWLLAIDLQSMALSVRFTDVDRSILIRAAKALRDNVVGTKLMLIVSEASEAMEALRDGGVTNPGNFMEELADIEIRVKDLANMMGGGLGAEEMKKVEKNLGRPYKHGREF